MNVDVILPNTRTAGECFLLTRITYLKNVINWTPAFAGVTVASKGCIQRTYCIRPDSFQTNWSPANGANQGTFLSMTNTTGSCCPGDTDKVALTRSPGCGIALPL